MAFQLLRFLSRETAGKSRIVVTSLVSGLSRGVLLASFNAAAAAGMAGHLAPRAVIGGFAAALAIYLASTYDSMNTARNVVETMVERLRLRLCAKLLLAQLRFLESQGKGELYTQLSGDLRTLSAAALTILGTFRAFVLLVFAFCYLFILSPVAFVAAILTSVFGIAVFLWRDHEARLSLRLARERQSAFYNIIGDLLSGFKELKLTRARHEGLMEHLSEVAGQSRDLNLKAENLFLVSQLSSQTFTFLLIAALVFVLPAVFPTTGPTIFQSLSTILFMVASVETLATAVPSLSRARVSLAAIEELEKRLDAGARTDLRNAVPPRNFHTIEFRDVHFRFEAAGPDAGFDVGPIDLAIRRNEILFVVGGNGAGKTTFLKLLTGLYPPSSGDILVDGQGVENEQAYREMFGAVFGDFHLFRQLYGVKPSQAFADALLTQLQIDNKTRMQEGELTAIDLSTGQRKRLAYAVARFLDRLVYVFDEFAADQDPAFRRYFYTELLPRLRDEGKTIVAVTHDERWFSVADRVVKMEYGRVAEIVEHDPAHEDAHRL